MKKLSLVLAGILLVGGVFAQDAAKPATKEKKVAKTEKKTGTKEKKAAKTEKKAASTEKAAK